MNTRGRYYLLMVETTEARADIAPPIPNVWPPPRQYYGNKRRID